MERELLNAVNVSAELKQCGNLTEFTRQPSALVPSYCMYVIIGKGQIAQKDHIGTTMGLRTKIRGKYISQVVF